MTGGGAFSFLLDANTYEARCVGRYDAPGGSAMVSTARVSDGERPFETAWQHPEYNGGKIVIVEAYDTREEAAAGHARWAAKMAAPELPEFVTECFNSRISQLARALGGGPDATHFRRRP